MLSPIPELAKILDQCMLALSVREGKGEELALVGPPPKCGLNASAPTPLGYFIIAT